MRIFWAINFHSFAWLRKYSHVSVFFDLWYYCQLSHIHRYSWVSTCNPELGSALKLCMISAQWLFHSSSTAMAYWSALFHSSLSQTRTSPTAVASRSDLLVNVVAKHVLVSTVFLHVVTVAKIPAKIFFANVCALTCKKLTTRSKISWYTVHAVHDIIGLTVKHSPKNTADEEHA